MQLINDKFVATRGWHCCFFCFLSRVASLGWSSILSPPIPSSFMQINTKVLFTNYSEGVTMTVVQTRNADKWSFLLRSTENLLTRWTPVRDEKFFFHCFYVSVANLWTKSRAGRKLILLHGGNERKLWIFLVVKQLRWLEKQWASDRRSALQATQKLIKTRLARVESLCVFLPSLSSQCIQWKSICI